MKILMAKAAALRYQQLSQLDGIVYREQPGRKTFATTLDRQACFVKLHGGVGWREIIKNLLQVRLPIIGATPEYRALTRLAALGIPSLQVVEYGVSGLNPATQRSYLVTQALTNTISLEDFCERWPNEPAPIALKRRLIRAVAELVGRMHGSGINHRDCYLCHIHLDESALVDEGTIALTLIDLHRAQIRQRVPKRWQIKDVAGLYFSAMKLGLTWRDYLWFVKHYAKASGLNPAKDYRYRFWQAVENRAYALFSKTYYRRDQGFNHYYLIDPAWQGRGLPANTDACDQAIAAGEILKDDATTTVAKITLPAGETVLIKRYNVRTIGKLFKRLCRRSRAYKAWQAGLRLVELGVLTPKPLALYEKRLGPFKTESYLITEYIEGEDIGHHFATYPAFLQRVIVATLQRWLASMKLLRMSHGDMKATNFLWHPAGIYILDLDACRTWNNAKDHQRALKKDTKRYAKNNWTIK